MFDLYPNVESLQPEIEPICAAHSQALKNRSESVFLDEGFRAGLICFAEFLTNEKAPRH